MTISLAEAQATVDRTSHALAKAIDDYRAEHAGTSYATAASVLKRKRPALSEAYGVALMELTTAAAGGPLGSSGAVR